MSRHEERVLVFQALYSWDIQGRPLPWTTEFSWAKEQQDLTFPRLMLQACLDQMDVIDSHIKDNLANWDFERVGKVELAILRVGVFGLLFQTDTDAAVTIHESVKIAQDFASGDAYKFVNGILDTVHKKHKKEQ